MDPLKSKMGKADPSDPAHAKYIRGLRSTDQLMKQFCKVESSVDKKAYDRGYIYSFEWQSSDPKKSRPDLVAAVKLGMDKGMLFEDAFDAVIDDETGT